MTKIEKNIYMVSIQFSKETLAFVNMSAISIPEPSIEQRVAFFAALNTANIQLLKTMLAENPRLVFSTRHNERGFHGLTPLEAIANPYSPMGFTPLETTNLIAVIFDTLQTFDLRTNRSWYIPNAIKQAIKNDNYMFIEELIKRNHPFTETEKISLHQESAYLCIRVFIQYKIDINYRINNQNGLFYAAFYDKPGTLENLKLLLENGYSIKKGTHPLSAASMANNQKTLTFLLQKFPEDINVRDTANWTPLHYAVHNATQNVGWESVKLLIDFPGCDLSAKTNDGQTPYSMLTSYLIRLRKDYSYTRQFTKDWIKNEIMSLWYKFFIALKDINLRNENGFTPLHVALKNEYIEMVEMLISSPDTDFTAETPDDETPFSILANIMLEFKDTPAYKDPTQKKSFEKTWMPVYEKLLKANDARSRSTSESSESSESNFEDVD